VDPVVASAAARVQNLVAPPPSLMKPMMMGPRVARGAARRSFAGSRNGCARRSCRLGRDRFDGAVVSSLEGPAAFVAGDVVAAADEDEVVEVGAAVV
jgi:hypothetical protein